MRRSVAPSIVLAVIGLLAGGAFRYFTDNPSEANLANYLRSGIHGMGLALSGWAVHLYFTSRSSKWVRRWPLVVEIAVRSVVMAIVVAVVAMSLQAALYGHRITPIDIRDTLNSGMPLAVIKASHQLIPNEVKKLDAALLQRLEQAGFRLEFDEDGPAGRRNSEPAAAAIISTSDVPI